MVLSHWIWSPSWCLVEKPHPSCHPRPNNWMSAILFFGVPFHLYLILPNPFPHNLVPLWRISELGKQSWLLMDCSHFLLPEILTLTVSCHGIRCTTLMNLNFLHQTLYILRAKAMCWDPELIHAHTISKTSFHPYACLPVVLNIFSQVAA